MIRIKHPRNWPEWETVTSKSWYPEEGVVYHELLPKNVITVKVYYQQLGWKIIPHLSNSPDPAPSDFLLLSVEQPSKNPLNRTDILYL